MNKFVFSVGAIPAAALALALSSGAAMASPTSSFSCNNVTLTCTGSYDAGTSPTELNNVGLQMQQFNQAGYYLTGVSVTFNAQISTSGTLTNGGNTQLTNVFAQVDSAFSATTVSSQLSTLVSAINGAGLDPLIKQTGATINANSSIPFTPTAPNLSPRTATTGALNLSDLADFAGSSTLSFDVSTNSSVAAGISGSGGSANVTAQLNTTADPSLTYTYTYAQTPVPEPASMALLGSGLFGLGWVRRRRAAKKG